MSTDRYPVGMVVYELHTGGGLGSREGLYASVEAAQGAADAKLAEWLAFMAEDVKRNPEDSYYFLTTALEWEMRPMKITRGLEGKPVLTGQYCQDYAFTIREIEVHE